MAVPGKMHLNIIIGQSSYKAGLALPNTITDILPAAVTAAFTAFGTSCPPQFQTLPAGGVQTPGGATWAGVDKLIRPGPFGQPGPISPQVAPPAF